jgi:hypothetical protein
MDTFDASEIFSETKWTLLVSMKISERPLLNKGDKKRKYFVATAGICHSAFKFYESNSNKTNKCDG